MEELFPVHPAKTPCARTTSPSTIVEVANVFEGEETP
jgi:hypothetical protein